MSDIADSETEPPKKGSKLPVILGLVLALVAGAGGFFAMRAGLLPFGAPGAADDSVQAETETASEPARPLPEAGFVPLDPLIISMPPASGHRHLRFTAQLEVPPSETAAVAALTPRITDVLNGYLRAVEVADLEDPTALMRLRAQMLRRVQVVTGPERVRDLLVMEFVLN